MPHLKIRRATDAEIIRLGDTAPENVRAVEIKLTGPKLVAGTYYVVLESGTTALLIED